MAPPALARPPASAVALDSTGLRNSRPESREEARKGVPAQRSRVTRRAGRARRGPSRGVQGGGVSGAFARSVREGAWLPLWAGGRAADPPPSAAASARQNQTPGPAGWKTCGKRELSLRVRSRSAVARASARAPVATSQPSLLDALGAATRPEWPPHRRGAAHLPRPVLRGPASRKLPSKGTLVRSLGKCSQSRGSRGGGGSRRAPSLPLYCSSVRAFFQPGWVDADTASNSLRSEIILPCPAQLLSCSPRVAMAPGTVGCTCLGIQASLRCTLG